MDLQLNTRSKRKLFQDEQPPTKVHLDIYNVLKNHTEPISLQSLLEYDISESHPGYPNLRLTNSELSKHLEFLIAKGQVTKSVHGFSCVFNSLPPADLCRFMLIYGRNLARNRPAAGPQRRPAKAARSPQNTQV